MKHALTLILAWVLASCASQQPAPLSTMSATRPAGTGLDLLTSPKHRLEEQLNQPPSAEALAGTSFGAEPGGSYEADVRVAMNRVLKDPDSAKYAFGAPGKDWVPLYRLTDPDLDQGKPFAPFDEARAPRGYVYGWSVPFTVNARNSYGGYTGAQRYKALFRDGSLIAVLKPGLRRTSGEISRWDVVVATTASPSR